MEPDWTEIPKRQKKPRYITERQAFNLQKQLDIMGLAKVLLSIESKNLQTDGWYFVDVLRGKDPDETDGVSTEPQSDALVVPEGCTWLLIPNKWNDKAVFTRRIPKARPLCEPEELPVPEVPAKRVNIFASLEEN